MALETKITIVTRLALVAGLVLLTFPLFYITGVVSFEMMYTITKIFLPIFVVCVLSMIALFWWSFYKESK